MSSVAKVSVVESCGFVLGECLLFLRQEIVRWKEKKKFVLPEVTTKMGKILQEILVLNT